MKRNLTKPLVRRRGAITGWRSLAFAPMWALIVLGTLVRLLSPSVAHAQITSAAQGNLIDQGFQLFTNETFNGNGRAVPATSRRTTITSARPILPSCGGLQGMRSSRPTCPG